MKSFSLPIRKLTALSLCIFIYTQSVLGQDQESEITHSPDSTVDTYLTRLLEQEQIPGLALAVIRNGKVVKAKGYGYANLEHRVPVKPETVFESGSLGKPFTALTVLSLVEDKVLELDIPITRYFDPAPDIWERITVRHLLTHTSGLSDYLLHITGGNWPTEQDLRKDFTEAELLEVIRDVSLDFEPGSAHAYSNTGYALLGLLIREVTGRHWLEVLRERVLDPLGMETAVPIRYTELVLNRASGYRLIDGKVANAFWIAPFWNSTADGAIYLSVLDLAKLESAFHEGRILHQNNLDQMWSPVGLPDGTTAGYGFGWFLAEPDGHRLISHGGSTLNYGFRNFFARFPEESLAVAVLTNSGWTSDARIALRVAEMYEPRLDQVLPEPVDLPGSALGRYIGSYRVAENTWLLPSGEQVTVEKHGNGIRLKAPGRPNLDFLPIRDGSCFLHQNLIELCFTMEDGGNVKELRLSRLIGGGVERADKI